MKKTNTKVLILLNMDKIMTTVQYKYTVIATLVIQQLHNYLPFSSTELKTAVLPCFHTSNT